MQRFWVQPFPDPGRRRIKWRPVNRVGYETSPVRLPVQTVRWCLRKSNTASVAKHRDLPSPVGKETKTSLPSRNSRTALSWSLVAAAYLRVRKACLMASFTSSTATPLTSSLGISRIDARRTSLVITRSDASFSGNLIGQNDIVLQCQAFRLNVPDHLSSPIKNGGRKWTGDETGNSLVSFPAPIPQKWLPPAKDGSAHFAAFLGLADSALPGFWLANQIARKYYIINSISIIIIIVSTD